jgi:Cytochrome C oxidase, cbb3-type, subunit III
VKLLIPSLLSALLAASCRQDMHDAPRLEAMEASAFFADGRSVRPLVPGTVARGRLEEDELLERGTLGGQLAAIFPFGIERADLERGRERYEIFCTPCHDSTGSGNGRVVQRGFQRPPSLHEVRLRDVPVGHLFDVITRGFGGMYDLADRIEPADRWRIAAWVRVLQRSQHATVADVPADERARLEAEGR